MIITAPQTLWVCLWCER